MLPLPPQLLSTTTRWRRCKWSLSDPDLCFVFFSQVSVGLLHGRASHIIWPPHRWQQIKPSLPANRGPLDTQEEEGWRHEHTNIQFKYVGNVIWSRRGVRQLQHPDRQTFFFKSQIQGNRRWSRSDGSQELFDCMFRWCHHSSVMVTERADDSDDSWGSSGVSVQHATAASLCYLFWTVGQIKSDLKTLLTNSQKLYLKNCSAIL